ncbi:MAG: hypothetical protein MJZ52_03795 [Bacteroidales bacterium]|nr:hypothetical protein [Bacteroidales bacterium]
MEIANDKNNFLQKKSSSVTIKEPSLAANFEISSCMKIFQKFFGKKFVYLQLKKYKV